MKRFRLSTLMLLVVVIALAVTLIVEHRRHRRREAELQARLALPSPLGPQLQAMRLYTSQLMVQLVECKDSELTIRKAREAGSE